MITTTAVYMYICIYIYRESTRISRKAAVSVLAKLWVRAPRLSLPHSDTPPPCRYAAGLALGRDAPEVAKRVHLESGWPQIMGCFDSIMG